MPSCRHILFVSFLAFISAYPAPAKVIFVAQDAIGDGSGSSWENACRTITAGLTTSASGDEVWIKSATYEESIDLKAYVAVYGGFQGTETEREQRNWRKNRTIVRSTPQDIHTVGGASAALLDGCVILSKYGRFGVRCDSSSPTLSNCIIERSAGGTGSGVYCIYSTAVFVNCIIRNTSDDGIYIGHANPTLINCTVTGNGLCGINMYYATARIINCTISHNLRGVYGFEANPRLEGCIITSNTTFGLRSYTQEGLEEGCDRWNKDCSELSPTLTNCLVVANGAEGVYFKRTSADLLNCTIADNAGPNVKQLRNHYTPLGGEPPFEDCACYPSLTNCVIQGATPLQAIVEYYEEVEDDPHNYYELVGTETRPRGEGFDVTYSCVQGGWPAGGGNISTDPLFVNPASGDYHLQPGSPCIDSGSNEAGQDIPLDLDGRIRIWNGVVDMGAYEFASWTPEEVRCDLNGDMRIDHEDLFLFRQSWHKSITPIPGP